MFNDTYSIQDVDTILKGAILDCSDNVSLVDSVTYDELLDESGDCRVGLDFPESVFQSFFR